MTWILRHAACRYKTTTPPKSIERVPPARHGIHTRLWKPRKSGPALSGYLPAYSRSLLAAPVAAFLNFFS